MTVKYYYICLIYLIKRFMLNDHNAYAKHVQSESAIKIGLLYFIQ